LWQVHEAPGASYSVFLVLSLCYTGTVAVCDGGSGALGHPLEYIQLNTVSQLPQVCKYCGLRFIMKKGHHHH
jgi:uncharacterized Zn-finger protein